MQKQQSPLSELTKYKSPLGPTAHDFVLDPVSNQE